MEERLENFTRKNRREFDEDEPPVGLWEKIEKKLDEEDKQRTKKGKVIRLNLLFRIAASLAVIVAAGLFFGQYQYNQATDLANIDPALAKQQMHYASVIKVCITNRNVKVKIC